MPLPPAKVPDHLREGRRGALAVIHLTNQRSSRMSPSEVRAPAVPVATPPRPYQLQGAKSHAGTAGLPEPGPYLPGHTQEGKGAIVDAGVPGYYKDIAAELAAMGRAPADVRALVLAHGHADHIGFAERLRRERRVSVSVR